MYGTIPVSVLLIQQGFSCSCVHCLHHINVAATRSIQPRRVVVILATLQLSRCTSPLKQLLHDSDVILHSCPVNGVHAVLALLFQQPFAPLSIHHLHHVDLTELSSKVKWRVLVLSFFLELAHASPVDELNNHGLVALPGGVMDRTAPIVVFLVEEGLSFLCMHGPHGPHGVKMTLRCSLMKWSAVKLVPPIELFRSAPADQLLDRSKVTFEGRVVNSVVPVSRLLVEQRFASTLLFHHCVHGPHRIQVAHPRGKQKSRPQVLVDECRQQICTSHVKKRRHDCHMTLPDSQMQHSWLVHHFRLLFDEAFPSFGHYLSHNHLVAVLRSIVKGRESLLIGFLQALDALRLDGSKDSLLIALRTSLEQAHLLSRPTAFPQSLDWYTVLCLRHHQTLALARCLRTYDMV
mmetsp:Transcript_35216/g.87445  ORF Transcript_35216/g.87445 Transcript_35216/m.87445 type:complete len:405 (-) Transcript_35216:952-2166(-)